MEWGLREDGFEVLTAHGLPESDAALRPDVIVLNSSVPEAGKRVLISALRYLVPDARIIDLMGDDAPSLYDTGADGYLRPPFRLAELQTIMAAILGRALDNSPRSAFPLD